VSPNSSSDVAARTQTSTLPLTGGDVVGLAVIGAGAALAGTVMVRKSRRTASV
jgi:LPXTG-motif cell wall-anchored protein